MKAPLLKFALIAALSSACATKYTISTKPEGAEVLVGDKPLGKTPLMISEADLGSKTGDGYLVRVRHPGYKHVWVWLPDSFDDWNIQLNLNPFYLRAGGGTAAGEHEISRHDLHRLSDRLLTLQMSLLLNQPVDAKEVDSFLESNPTLGSMHFISAIKLLKDGKKDESLTHLRDAMRFAPQEFDFLSLYNELDKTGTPAPNAPAP